MASEVTVFVVFRSEETSTPIDIRIAAHHVSAQQPRWSIGAVGQRSFRLGRYDQLPVLVTLQQGFAIAEESRLMAKQLRKLVEPRILESLAGGTARLELHWDLRADRDVVPETASLIIDCAQALARLTQGVTLVEGTRVVDSETEFDNVQAFAALFP